MKRPAQNNQTLVCLRDLSVWLFWDFPILLSSYGARPWLRSVQTRFIFIQRKISFSIFRSWLCASLKEESDLEADLEDLSVQPWLESGNVMEILNFRCCARKVAGTWLISFNRRSLLYLRKKWCFSENKISKNRMFSLVSCLNVCDSQSPTQLTFTENLVYSRHCGMGEVKLVKHGR